MNSSLRLEAVWMIDGRSSMLLAIGGVFTPVLAKHSKSFNLIDTLAFGVDRRRAYDAIVVIHVGLCSPRRKFSIRCSEVRSENVRMLMVVVLSVQFRKTLASHTYKFATS
jgi:hypothetical protein